MSAQVESLVGMPLRGFPGLFSSLEPPERGMLRGMFRGAFVGPGWLVRLAGPMLVISGLGGWWGKRFDDQGDAVNLVWRQESGHCHLEQRFPMLLREDISLMDRKAGLTLHYAPGNPLPWPWIVDEVRLLQPGLLLGITIANLKGLSRLWLPFTLQLQDDAYGL